MEENKNENKKISKLPIWIVLGCLVIALIVLKIQEEKREELNRKRNEIERQKVKNDEPKKNFDKEYWSSSELQDMFIGQSSNYLINSLGNPSLKKQLVSGNNSYAYTYQDNSYRGKYIRFITFWVVNEQVIDLK